MTTPWTVARDPELFVGIISAVECDCWGTGRLFIYSPTRKCLVNISFSVFMLITGVWAKGLSLLMVEQLKDDDGVLGQMTGVIPGTVGPGPENPALTTWPRASIHMRSVFWRGEVCPLKRDRVVIIVIQLTTEIINQTKSDQLCSCFKCYVLAWWQDLSTKTKYVAAFSYVVIMLLLIFMANCPINFLH